MKTRAKPDHSSFSAGCAVSFELNVVILSLPLCVLVSAASMLLADLTFLLEKKRIDITR